MKSEDNCLDYNGYDLYLRECDGLMQNQKWEYKVRASLAITARLHSSVLCGYTS